VGWRGKLQQKELHIGIRLDAGEKSIRKWKALGVFRKLRSAGHDKSIIYVLIVFLQDN